MSFKGTILGFTTSTDQGSVCLFHKGKIQPQIVWTRQRAGSEALTSKIKSYLKKHRVNFGDISLIAVDKGPGSFTGSRIAVNVAKTIGYTLEIPIFATSSIEILAQGVLKFENLLVLLDAHRALFYFNFYKNGKASTKVQALDLKSIISEAPDLGRLSILGNLAPNVMDDIKKEITLARPNLKIEIPKKKDLHSPQAKNLVALASQENSKFSGWADVEPSYVRSPDVVERLARQD